METHISDITRVIQLAVAPVFLLTAIGTFITALNNRLARAVAPSDSSSMPAPLPVRSCAPSLPSCKSGQD